MTRTQATPYVSFVVDDAGSGRSLGDDPHAVVREACAEFKYPSVLVGWQCGLEPLFVAVHSYLDVKLDDDEAEEMVGNYLAERGWFSGDRTDSDYIIR